MAIYTKNAKFDLNILFGYNTWMENIEEKIISKFSLKECWKTLHLTKSITH